MSGPAVAGADPRRLAERIFHASLATTAVITLLCLILLLTGRQAGGILGNSQVNAEAVVRILLLFLIFTVLWGWLWYGLKRGLLRQRGFSNEELALVFSSRMNQPFDLPKLLAGRSERMIRILDMIGRRGRFVPLGLAGFLNVYVTVSDNPSPEFLTAGLQYSLLDAVCVSWFHLAAYRSEGFLGRVVFGAQTRIMDGTLGRANCLLITMLWSLFRFVMVPLGGPLSRSFPPQTFAVLFAFIWLSYLACDAMSEIVGAVIGRQRLRVWGIGDVNRKSVEGTIGGFLASLLLCLGLVHAHGLPASWIGLAVAVSISNSLLELVSPRGTDDFTMAIGNALLCWIFGVLVY